VLIINRLSAWRLGRLQYGNENTKAGVWRLSATALAGMAAKLWQYSGKSNLQRSVSSQPAGCGGGESRWRHLAGGSLKKTGGQWLRREADLQCGSPPAIGEK